MFHAATGIGRFYLYNNDSTDDFHEVIHPFRQHITIEVVDWPGVNRQESAYNDCLARARDDGVAWLAFIDDDEFLFPTRARTLPDLLLHYCAFAGLGACWILFGSSGREKSTPGWVIRRFTRRFGPVDRHVKCIVQPSLVERSVVVGHQFLPRAPMVVVNENGEALASPFSERPTADCIRVHHYLTKSIEEMVARRSSRHVTGGDRQLVPLSSWLDWERGWNDTVDLSIHRFLPAMRNLAARLGIEEPIDPTLP